jgi:hypothetical protein
MSEALPSYDPILIPLYTLYCIRVYSILIAYSHREGGEGGGELTREKIRGAIVHKAG